MPSLDSTSSTSPSPSRKIKVAIVGAGISGLALANGLLKDPSRRYDVQLYERDTIAFTSERGGYQLRIDAGGLEALRTVCGTSAWAELVEAWGPGVARAPAIVNPYDYGVCLKLDEVKVYPQSKPVARIDLRHALIRAPLKEERIHFGYKFERFELAREKEGGVVLHFTDRKPVVADIVVAADGSSSKVNTQVGLNNKVKLDSWTLVQCRGVISEATYRKLPSSLRDCAATMFLGGSNISGFSSVYNLRDTLREPAIKPTEEEYSLYWSLLIPAVKGREILEKAGADEESLISMVVDYIRNDLHYSEALPFVINSATSNLRTGLLTSSVKPDDWRGSDMANSRIILMGDAVHPMTPGRGQGANQAITDAGTLTKLLLASNLSPGPDFELGLTRLVHEFDNEMIPRAFKMVKASEEVTDVDLTLTSGRVKVAALRLILIFIGWVLSALEAVGLKKQTRLDFSSHTT